MSVQVERKKTKQQQSEFQIGQNVVYGLKGIYCIDAIEVMEMGGLSNECYVLTNIFDNTIHKTYLPKNQASKQLREHIPPITLTDLKKFLNKMDLEPENFYQNSNKKIIAYEARIVKAGFHELYQAYFCVKVDLETNTKTDKRYFGFKDRLRNLIIEEIATANKCEKPEAAEIFDAAEKIFTSH